MKPTKTITASLILLLVILSCNKSTNKTKTSDFGIYETFNIENVPQEIKDQLNKSGIQLETDQNQPVLAYVNSGAHVEIIKDNKGEIRLLKTDGRINEEQDLVQLIALKAIPGINGQDVKSAKRMKDVIEYKMTVKGAKKWADLTGRSKNKLLAFVWNNKIISLTKVNAKINNGRTLIKLEDNSEIIIELENAFM